MKQGLVRGMLTDNVVEAQPSVLQAFKRNRAMDDVCQWLGSRLEVLDRWPSRKWRGGERRELKNRM